MDKQLAAASIIAKALPLAVFDGWSITILQQAAIAAGYNKADILRIFPGGAIEAVNTYMRISDEQMVTALEAYHLASMKFRERVATAVRLRLSVMEPHKEAVRKAVALQTLPMYMPYGLKNLYATVDAIWFAVGDTSLDFSFYTKRLTLAAVYSATLLNWLNDKSPGHNDSWAFLDRRIENVMAFEKAKQRLRGLMARPLVF